jgi:hypothetical protein
MSEIRFLVEFEDGAEAPQFPEDVTAGQFAIFVDAACLTRNRPAGHRRSHLIQADTVFGPVAGLVDWLIENWAPVLWETHTPFKKSALNERAPVGAASHGESERLANWPRDEDEGCDDEILPPAGDFDIAGGADERDTPESEEWQHRHLLGHGSSDLAIPSILILPEDRNVVLKVKSLPTKWHSSVEFLGPNDKPRLPSLFVCRKIVFKEAARAFIEKTLEHAQSNTSFASWAEWLRSRWQDAQTQEANPASQLRWMLGEVSASRIQELERNDPPKAQSLSQLLLDCRIATERSELRPAEALIGDFALKPDSSFPSNDTPRWRTVSNNSISTNQPYFAQGYDLARSVRQTLGLGTRPIEDLSRLLARLDIQLEDACQTSLFRVAVCAPTRGSAHIIPSTLDQEVGSYASSRFAIASALGRLLWQSKFQAGRPICVAQGDQAMVTQSRRANAFAAEFLLPGEVILQQDPHNPQIGRLSETYGLSRYATKLHAMDIWTNISRGHEA